MIKKISTRYSVLQFHFDSIGNKSFKLTGYIYIKRVEARQNWLYMIILLVNEFTIMCSCHCMKMMYCFQFVKQKQYKFVYHVSVSSCILYFLHLSQVGNVHQMICVIRLL